MVDRNQDKKIFLIKKFQLYVCILYKMEGISNKTIAKFFAEKASDDVKKIISVFPSNFVILASNVSRNSFFKVVRKYSIRYFMVLKSLTRKTMKSL